ncbi:hypothetical protein PsW74_00404 [Pseudovibrio sp. W74]|nr:hypothetical protein PsW74_00404 [Pseudovibrio sp. W74]
MDGFCLLPVMDIAATKMDLKRLCAQFLQMVCSAGVVFGKWTLQQQYAALVF